MGYNRCAEFHDYSMAGTYHITLNTEPRRPLFGTLINEPNPWVKLSTLGKMIVREEMGKISAIYPMVEIWDYCIMPDHIHMIVRVNEKLPRGLQLGNVIAGFKGGCSRAYWSLFGKSDRGIWHRRFNDSILMKDRQIDGWKFYIADNPRRASMKKLNPNLFKIEYNYHVAGTDCQILGNQFLLDYPDKDEVIVHGIDTPEIFVNKFRLWMECGQRGGVLVSAAIAPRERQVILEAFKRGYKVIRLRANGFKEPYKPEGKSFDACAEGRLLLVCPAEYQGHWGKPTRKQCEKLNKLAQVIAMGKPQP